MSARPAPPRPPAPAVRPAAHHPARAGRGGPSSRGRGGESAPLRPAERARLRRVVRAGLVAVVVVEALVLVVTFVPEVRAAGPTWVTNMWQASTPLNRIDGKLLTTNRHLADIERHTDRSRELAERHSQSLGGGAWDPALAAVTSGPMGRVQGGLAYSDENASDKLATLVPGAVPWKNYHEDYAKSADAAILTLRSSLDALNDQYKQIEDDSRLRDLARQASSTDSYLAMDELQVQSQLEVARQLHALRAQQALSTNLYAVAESHRIGAEARTNAKDSQANCKILKAVFGGAGEAVKRAFCR